MLKIFLLLAAFPWLMGTRRLVIQNHFVKQQMASCVVLFRHCAETTYLQVWLNPFPCPRKRLRACME
jgi:hypothetical protein